ncbi:short chain dehydrogenase [Nocardia amikacinitolerans]|uniref:SDR family NAD(P)-dependent oxidoreductase n=1 Tax=Nocardia amikacinitolerans TaxID=756689 RepID=UPI0020A447CD|nr:SDR family oxidoreductase [Nocardia amikacinitolerans]MCP2294754.1 short chain dehydrogenase [Nocardia amikacinitolerans]
MTRTLAIFGYGPGLGVGTARRFGKEGFRVAVVGRDGERANRNAERLGAEGIEAAAFSADITDARQLQTAVDDITTILGPIDVAMHGAAADPSARTPSTLEVDVAALAVPIALKLHSPILLTRALAPAMIERGDGALLFSSGSSERHLLPYLANFGIVLAAQRAYVRQLHAELEGTGVYVGLLNIGALIGNSKAERMVDEHPELVPPGVEIPRITNDELGEHYWRMYTERVHDELDVGFPA